MPELCSASGSQPLYLEDQVCSIEAPSVNTPLVYNVNVDSKVASVNAFTKTGGPFDTVGLNIRHVAVILGAITQKEVLLK